MRCGLFKVDSAHLAYQLITADADATNQEPYTFYADTYTGLTDDTDRVDYSFTNGTNILGSYNQRYVILYDEFYSRIGVRSVYTVGNDTRFSDVAWFTTDNISSITDSGKTVKRIDYYDAAGRHLTTPTRGFYIRSVTYTDGTVKNTKLLKR